MDNYTQQCEIANKLANAFGADMASYGTSQYSERINSPNPMPELQSNPEFLALPKEFQREILNYGCDRKTYAMSQYNRREVEKPTFVLPAKRVNEPQLEK
jgi:hypothetical protein